MDWYVLESFMYMFPVGFLLLFNRFQPVFNRFSTGFQPVFTSQTPQNRARSPPKQQESFSSTASAAAWVSFVVVALLFAGDSAILGEKMSNPEGFSYGFHMVLRGKRKTFTMQFAKIINL